MISAVLGRKIRIYGDGKQVRDLLHVDDLIAAYELAIQKRDEMNGRIFNIGGGASFSRSILGLVHQLERLTGAQIPHEHFEWRAGDQPVYISDIRKAERELGWKPQVDAERGVERLFEWVRGNRDLVIRELGELLRT